jgi:ribosomal protein L2
MQLMAQQHLVMASVWVFDSTLPCAPVRHLQDIPVGMPVHSIELVPGKGGQICRSAGCMATIVNKQTEHAIVRLPSGKSQLKQLSQPPATLHAHHVTDGCRVVNLQLH